MDRNAILNVKLQSNEISLNFSSRAYLNFNKLGANIYFSTFEDGIHFENSIAVGKEKIAIYKGLSSKQDLENMPEWISPLNIKLMQEGKILLIDKESDANNTFAKYGEKKIGLSGKYLNIFLGENEVKIDFEKVKLKAEDDSNHASLGLHCFRI